MLNKLNELRAQKEEGFTLIELLVVIVIIGVLAAIALPIFLNQQKAAIKAGMKNDVRNAVASVATMAVKNPTFSGLSGQNSKGVLTGAATPTYTPASYRINLSISDSNTVLQANGSWNNWNVSANNTAVADTAGATAFYTYTSITGKYEEGEG